MQGCISVHVLDELTTGKFDKQYSDDMVEDPFRLEKK